ncbi:hypothetical protein BC830DRAFT_1152831 [Chytriomyces sp. MP71]|nr:hypothetical protein BC830DRAFT_1152831 [Chytriomyces sp. MP71]
MIRTLALFYLPAAVRGYATSLNKIILIGNVGQHPEFRVLKEGNSAATSANGPRGVWSFSVATERRYKRAGSNEWQSSTEWHRVNQYGTQAKPQFADRWIQKGTKVQIEGRVSYYKNKKGRMYASIIAGM